MHSTSVETYVTKHRNHPNIFKITVSPCIETYACMKKIMKIEEAQIGGAAPQRSSTLYVVKQQCWEKAEQVPGRGSGTLAWLQDCTALYLSDNITKM
jgi:hypothetical protein